MTRPKLAAAAALLPACLILGVCFYGFIGWTAVISVTGSRLLPRYDFTGLANYAALAGDDRFARSFAHLLVFGTLHIGLSMGFGLLLAVGLDRAGPVRGRILWLAFLLPLSLSWLVTGLVWQWLLNPGSGMERAMHALGWAGFRLDALGRGDTAVYCLVAAAVWHMAGLVAMLFLAGLRRVDPDVWHAARAEGIPTWRTYLHVVLPTLRGTALSCALLLFFGVVRTFDLVAAMTGGGPGFATDMPALFIQDMAFGRGRLALGAAASVVLMAVALAAAASFLVPVLVPVLGRRSRAVRA